MSDHDDDSAKGQSGPYGQPADRHGPYGQSADGHGPYGAPPQHGAPPQYGAAPQYGQPAGLHGQQAYGQQVAGPSYASGYAPSAPSWNVFAILAIVFAFLFAPAGAVFGHIGLHQIRRTGEQGRPLALAGLILGYVFTALWVIGVVLWIVLLATLIGHGGSSDYPNA